MILRAGWNWRRKGGTARQRAASVSVRAGGWEDAPARWARELATVVVPWPSSPCFSGCLSRVLLLTVVTAYIPTHATVVVNRDSWVDLSLGSGFGPIWRRGGRERREILDR